MSLQFILGGSGSGKSYELYTRIIQHSIEFPEKRFLVIVPEQFTMQTQKELVRLHPNKGILNIDVLSFGRLAYRVFEELGADRRTVLEDTGKNLLLRKVAMEKEDQLIVLKGQMKKLGYITRMKSMISELAQYDMTPQKMDEMLQVASENQKLYYKLQDVNLLYEGFRERMSQKYITAEEVLEVLCQMAGRSELLKGSVLALDGFTGFTPIQLKLMGELMQVAEQIFVTVTVGTGEDPYRMYGEHELFHLSKQTLQILTKIARETSTEIDDGVILGTKGAIRFAEAPGLGFLEKNLLRREGAIYDKEVKEISIHTAKSPIEEAEYVARTIGKLIRKEEEQPLRYQDIAIITGDMASYGNHMKKVLTEYNIPAFLDETKTILLNPFIEFVRAALETVQNRYPYESMFRLLRTGLCRLTREETDILENYVLAAGVRGYKQWREPFTRETYKMKEGLLEHCNQLREQVMEVLSPFTDGCKKRKITVGECTEHLYRLLVTCEIQLHLKKEEERFREVGILDKAKEYNQIYGIVMELLDKMVELLGDETITLREYAQLLDAGFEEAKVGMIPPTVDQVVVGDIERTRLKDIRVLFFVGLNDGWVPKKSDKGGIISDVEREALLREGIELAPSGRQNMYTQRFYLYLNMTKPKEHLYLSFSKADTQGKPLCSSYIIGDIKKLFPGISVTDEDVYDKYLERITGSGKGLAYLIEGLREMAGSPEENEEFYTLYNWYQKKNPEKMKELLEAAFYSRSGKGIGKIAALALYGETLENSVTRLEQFAACAFAHFLKYGLHLNERDTYEFKPMDMGNVFHNVLELFSKKLEHRGYSWFTLAEEDRQSLMEESMEEVVQEYGAQILYSSFRNQYAIERMKRIIRRSLWALCEQVKAGRFKPENYEVSFAMVEDLDAVNITLSDGEKMKLKGRIDRIDTCEEEDKVYVKVVDYKSGNTSFDIVALYYGLQLQLVVYLNAAMELEKRIHPEKEIIPGGIFYYNMQDPMLDREDGEDVEAINTRLLKKLKPSGLVNMAPEIVKNLDTGMTSDSAVIPVAYNKDGSPSRYSSVADGKQFAELSAYVNQKMVEIGTHIQEGRIEAEPYVRKDRTPCEYCSFKEVCVFDEKLPGCSKRRLKELKPDEVWKKIEGEEE